MRRGSRLITSTGSLAILLALYLTALAGGPTPSRMAALVGGLGAVGWTAWRRKAKLREGERLLLALVAGGAFWLAGLDLLLLETVLMARGLLLLLTAGGIHLSLLFAGARRPGRLGRVLQWLAVSATLVLGTLALVETVVRAVSPLRTYELVPDDPGRGPCLVRLADGRLTGVPGCGGRYLHREFAGVRAEFNALGLRDSEADARPPAADELSVLVLGDSFAYGMGVDLDETFQEKLGERLRAAGLSARVYGAAMPGAGTVHERRVLEVLAPVLEPDAVVVALFEDNDLQDNWAGLHAAPPRPTRPGEPPGPLRFLATAAHFPYWRTSASLLQLTRVDGRPTAVLASALEVPPDPAVRPLLEALLGELEAIRELSTDLGAELVVLLIPAIVQAEESSFETFEAAWPERRYSRTAFHEQLAGALDERAFRVVDTLGALEAAIGAGRILYHREGHWNAAGHALAAERLADVLTRLLRRREGEDRAAPPAAEPASGSVRER